MTAVQIELLTETTKRHAQQIAVQAKVGPSLRIIRFFNKSLRKQTKNIFVALNNGTVIGLIGWYQDDGHWAGKSLKQLFPYGKDIYWVSYFAVKDAFRGQGIGSLLMQKLLQDLRQMQADELWVYTSRAREFYEKIGFVFVTRAFIENADHDFLKFIF